MADSQYPYPPDRFDDEADASSFHGAHRAEEPFWRQNLVYIVIIAAAFVTLVVLLFVIGNLGRGGDERSADPTTPAASSEAAQSDGGGASEAPAAEADKSTPVLVVNAGGINGLAGTWQSALEDDGWEKVDVGTADNRQQEAVVFYRDEADAASAQALADSVGAGEARQSDEYDASITFVAIEEPADDFGSGDGEG
ncbi:LytR C-terminal domain-containing protein [Brachybacterium rhamnosum]|uniref:LytR C-terminal domain-containing protein n=1 Tax=Brachybacterium rhamnosum TaxID=173361 RepID=A0ABW4Q423_9MICO|nr:LytR C-terminal domain-containing protein [Brachybacterium sp. SGAir0954]QCR54754.1 hypothetical protein C1N80_14990 [Brachybacterium sp. SGAir0954]